jgi:hypothetical protein
VEPLAWDADGALYHLWSEGDDLMLGRSADLGATWKSRIAANDGRVAFFPYLIGRGSGELAATWFSGAGDEMMVNVALIQVPTSGDGSPLIVRAEPFQQDSWREAEGSLTRDPAGEYVPVIFLGDAELGIVNTVQNPRGGRLGFSWRRIEVTRGDGLRP